MEKKQLLQDFDSDTNQEFKKATNSSEKSLSTEINTKSEYGGEITLL